MSDIPRPKIGTGIYICKDGKVLMGKRRGKNGAGYWCAPGGHLEMNEGWEENAKRETMEEAGIEIENIRFITATNDINDEDGKHYVTLQFAADWLSGEPGDVEPDKMGDWGWYDWSALPEPLFLPARNFVKSGYNPLNFPDNK